MESKTLRDSDLITHQPCHIPGYAGWCRTMPSRYGGTFGRLTHDILKKSDPNKTVLARMWPAEDPRNVDISAVRARNDRGEAIYNEQMIPGYTGKVPTMFEKYGGTYRNLCNEAIGDFERNQSRKDWKFVTPENTKYKLPRLKPVCKTADHFYSKDIVPPPVSPYYMKHGDPRRYFVSGYGGYIPQRRYLIGLPYPIETTTALKNFDDLQGNNLFNAGRDVYAQENYIKRNPMMSDIYRESCGLIPRYTGHVPGYRARFGKTFGAATTNPFLETGITQGPTRNTIPLIE